MLSGLLVAAGIRRQRVVVDGVRPFERLAADLPAEQTGDRQHGGIHPGILRAVVIRRAAPLVSAGPHPFPIISCVGRQIRSQEPRSQGRTPT